MKAGYLAGVDGLLLAHIGFLHGLAAGIATLAEIEDLTEEETDAFALDITRMTMERGRQVKAKDKATTRNRADKISKAEWRALRLQGAITPEDDFMCSECGYGFFHSLEVNSWTAPFTYCPGCGRRIETD